MFRLFSIPTILVALFSCQVYANEPKGSAYLDGGSNVAALILVHGSGGHPRGEVVDAIRNGVNDKLVLHTLSLRVTSKRKSIEKYAEDFPPSYEIIKQGIHFLREERGVKKIFLVGYALGARMVTAFVADNPDQPVNGLIVIDCGNNGGYPLSCKENLEKIRIPVLDLWLKEDNSSSDAASERNNLASSTYKQKAIPCPKCVSMSRQGGSRVQYERKLTGNSIKWIKNQL